MKAIENDKKLIISSLFCITSKNSIGSLNDLLKAIKKLKKELEKLDSKKNIWKGKRHNLSYGIYFRGLSKFSHSLKTSIGRKKFTQEQERNLLHRFRRRSYNHYERILSDWETIFLARHHGLPTRLLDWSSNPLVSLYLACEDNRKSDGALWSFVRQPQEHYDLNIFNAKLMNEYKHANEFKFLIKGIKIIYPFYSDPRMIAQAILFTVQDDNSISLNDYLKKYNFECIEREDFDLFHIRKWKIPSDRKKDILAELNDFGINYQSVYPDIDGLARGLPKTEIERKK